MEEGRKEGWGEEEREGGGVRKEGDGGGREGGKERGGRRSEEGRRGGRGEGVVTRIPSGQILVFGVVSVACGHGSVSKRKIA